MATPIRPLPAGERTRRLPGLRAILVALGVLAAVNLLIFAAHTGGQGQDTGPPLPEGIRYLVPVPGSVIRPQDDVGAQLKETYTGALFIDDVRIPDTDAQIDNSLGVVRFRPGPNKEITALRPGHHYATIHFWPQDKGDEDAARAADAVKSYTWQFTAG
jgi:hypothetical protein